MHLFPAMETATLAQSANRVWECMVHIMKEHFVPTMLSSMDRRHKVVNNWLSPRWILLQEFLPRVRVVEVCNEHPCCGVARTCETRDRKKECKPVVENEVAQKEDNKPLHA